MFCTQCGNQIPDGSTFCPVCGARLTAQQAPAQPAPVPTPEPTYQQAPAQPTYQQAPAQPAYQQAPDYQQQASYQQAPNYQQAPGYQQAPTQPASQQIPFIQTATAALKNIKLPSSIGELFCGYNKAGVQYAESTGLQMKWYKALAAALLYLAAISNLIVGLQNLFGLSYGESSSYIYSLYPGMRVLDLIYGIVLIALAVAILYIRMHLAQFKSDGPSLYLMLLLVNVGITVVYSLLTVVLTRYSDFSTLGGTIVGGVAMFALNNVYFSKRQHLFTM